MYVRGLVVKGHTYFRIVEGVREGPKVRQRDWSAPQKLVHLK
jgi:hypothetical protein